MPDGAGGTGPRTWRLLRFGGNWIVIADEASVDCADEDVRVVEQQPPTEGRGAILRTTHPARMAKQAGVPREFLDRLADWLDSLPPGPPEPTQGDEWDPATVDAVVRELESEDDVTVNVKLTSGPKFRAGWDAAVAHIVERFKGAARDTGGRDL